MPVINTDEFGYDEEEVKKLNWEDFAKDEFWNSCDDMGELEDKYDITFHKVQPQLTIPKSIADELEEEIEEAYSNDYIRSYSDVGAYMEVITDGLDEDSELYKFMFPANDALLGCSHRNVIYLYLVDNDLVKVVEG
ncbi:hypothetical protein [Lactococcus taiwanensis]|uniref:hypothetical protein n=1 Tax=Lactococcus taiwanensis TaxID=1151742 RepID=UPI0019645BB0|nr:hypothetical protein [Lactococcus taiwanensis]QRZ11744.1 hypothetical protein JVB21_03620 [Lactococcus taiwanensis]